MNDNSEQQEGGPEVIVTVTMSGLKDPAAAASQVARFVYRSLYHVDGIPGEFTALVEAHCKADAPGGEIRIKIGGEKDPVTRSA